ncbi:HesB/IscA family protein [Bartonella sp. DGB2]|uniref:HesB/IscA family protein n=1 Tax=Bartonella sp. DGB2 TaxID=3388426 RepID=UPI00398FCE31
MAVEISSAAAKRISQILSKEPGKIALRVSVEGGGCSGFSYRYDLVDCAQDGDLLLEKDGAKILIDLLSIPFLEGATLDFIDDLMGESFKMNNPNATSSCGCGVSFSL